jgi:hypothetical protein
VGWEELDEKFILSACRGILGLALYKEIIGIKIS